LFEWGGKIVKLTWEYCFRFGELDCLGQLNQHKSVFLQKIAILALLEKKITVKTLM